MPGSPPVSPIVDWHPVLAMFTVEVGVVEHGSLNIRYLRCPRLPLLQGSHPGYTSFCPYGRLSVLLCFFPLSMFYSSLFRWSVVIDFTTPTSPLITKRYIKLLGDGLSDHTHRLRWLQSAAFGHAGFLLQKRAHSVRYMSTNQHQMIRRECGVIAVGSYLFNARIEASDVIDVFRVDDLRLWYSGVTCLKGGNRLLGIMPVKDGQGLSERSKAPSGSSCTPFASSTFSCKSDRYPNAVWEALHLKEPCKRLCGIRDEGYLRFIWVKAALEGR